MSTNSSISKIYNERKDFVIIGLTGRTGSGCSKVAEILEIEEFDNLDLRDPKSRDFENSEERKYSIIHEYANANGNWKPFKVISMSSIITWFIVEKGYNEFIEYLIKIHKDGAVEFDFGKIKSELEKTQDKFKSINDLLNQLDENEEICKEDLIKQFENIEEFSIELKEILKEISCTIIEEKYDDLIYSQFYTFLYQKIGSNIRASGNPFEEEFIGDAFFTLAEKCNELIKAIREVDKKGEDPKQTLICLDAIRNPFEASFFKDRYSAFYLISVNTEDETRRKRLSHLRKEEIDSLDEREYPRRLKSHEKFYNQDIGSCLEISDIHIYNPDIEDSKYYELTEQILKYITLMIHPGLVTPTNLERCMQVAYNAKLNSGCLSRQVGAVVTNKDYAIISVGWNEVPKGQVSCSLRDVYGYCRNKDINTYSYYERTNEKFDGKLIEISDKIKLAKLEGRKYPFCFKDIYNEIENKKNQVHTRALHAEENAILQVSKYGGIGIKGGNLFTTASPCELCSKKAFQLGVKNIYYIDPYPGISQSHILNFGEDDNPKLILFKGAIGNAYISLYTPKMPYKDELEMIIRV